MSESKNYSKAKAYCDKHPGAFSIVKKEDHSIFKDLSDKEFKELKAHVESKVLDIGILTAKQPTEQQIKDLEIVKEDGLYLEYVEEQTPEICMEAVKQNCFALEYVKEQTPELCMEAVKQNGRALSDVKSKTKELCIQAIKTNGWDAVSKYISAAERFEFKLKESDFK